MAPTTPSSWRRRVRLLALGAVLVAFDAVAVAVAYVLAHVALGLLPLLATTLDHLFWSLSFDLVPLWPVVAVGTPLVLVAQSVFGYRLTLAEAAPTGVEIETTPDSIEAMRRKIDREEAAGEIADRVSKLAHTADMRPPEVTVIDSETPNSFVVSRPGERTLFVTTGLVETLDGEQLDAVLAHELAHLTNGDAIVMTAAAFLPTITDRVTDLLTRLLRRSFLAGLLFDDPNDDDSSLWSWGQLQLVVVLFSVVAVPTVAALSFASTACYRLLSWIREYGADAGAVAICGSPAALAGALETLTADGRPEHDARAAEAGVRELCVLPYAIEEADESASGDSRAARLSRRFDRFQERLLPGSHPPVDDRVATLRARQAAVDDPEERAV